jgi:hypothetical protein
MGDCPGILNLGDNVHAINDTAKDNVLAVQMGCAAL